MYSPLYSLYSFSVKIALDAGDRPVKDTRLPDDSVYSQYDDAIDKMDADKVPTSRSTDDDSRSTTSSVSSVRIFFFGYHLKCIFKVIGA